MQDDGMDEATIEQILKGEVQEFLSEFEASEETEDDMKTLFPLWRDKILGHAREIGGGVEAQVKTLMNVCEDYARNRGMLERIRMEAEETRLHLGL
ncbi:MAG: hypothetical protein H7A41_04405 [Chlamydiales bacterium]|nr:hypothetical protein [Chlamydiales bacterium]